MSKWFADAAERAVKTFLQGFLAVITLDQFMDTSVGWDYRLLGGVLAGLYSVASSVASAPVGAPNSASVLGGDEA